MVELPGRLSAHLCSAQVGCYSGRGPDGAARDLALGLRCYARGIPRWAHGVASACGR